MLASSANHDLFFFRPARSSGRRILADDRAPAFRGAGQAANQHSWIDGAAGNVFGYAEPAGILPLDWGRPASFRALFSFTSRALDFPGPGNGQRTVNF